MDSREQKNHLRKVLHELFGNVVDIETTVECISSQSIDNQSDYGKIIKALSKFRGHDNFNNNNRKPECDFVITSKRIIIEYDERQHFSKAREISLSNYPEDIKTFFDKSKWIERCQNINAKDNDPKDRDERRAFYDSVRDIEAYRNGWYLIRFFHGEVDWSEDSALQYLKKRISTMTKTKIESTRNNARILRLVMKNEDNPYINEDKAFNFVAQNIKDNKRYDYLVTPGGFLDFKWLDKFADVIKDQKESQKMIPELKKAADERIQNFWNALPEKTKQKIKSSIKFITFGIDSFNENKKRKIMQKIELVALFDTTKSKVIHWTGKSYPTINDQKERLIELDLNTHFVKVNKEKLCLLGCHDLKMVSPRAEAKVGETKLTKRIQFDELMKEFKPNVIIQHPHTTDTYKIWNTEWKTIEKRYPFVSEYVSGIRYFNTFREKPRGELDAVLINTKLGVVDTIAF